MSQAKITLIGMYNYDNTLFDDLQFPEGIDRDLAIQRIINKSEEFELVYADFDYLKDRIGIWGRIWERTFSRWVKALGIDYDPLYNYDRHEEILEQASSSSNTVTGSDTSSTTENKVSAYDSDAFTNKEKDEGKASTSQFGSGDAKANNLKSARMFGNIGVTTSQQMLRDELDIAAWSMYEHIADIFVDEFCILVY